MHTQTRIKMQSPIHGTTEFTAKVLYKVARSDCETFNIQQEISVAWQVTPARKTQHNRNRPIQDPVQRPTTHPHHWPPPRTLFISPRVSPAHVRSNGGVENMVYIK